MIRIALSLSAVFEFWMFKILKQLTGNFISERCCGHLMKQWNLRDDQIAPPNVCVGGFFLMKKVATLIKGHHRRLDVWVTGRFGLALWWPSLRRSISQHSIERRGRHCCLWRTLENGREAGNNKRNENEKKRGHLLPRNGAERRPRRWHE